MRVNARLFAAFGALALATAVVPMMNVSAHYCESPTRVHPVNPGDPNSGCDGNSCPSDGQTHKHYNWVGGSCESYPCWPPGHCRCPHSSPHSHSYGSGGSAGARSDTVTGGDEVGAGLVTVFETNAQDCDGDGVPGDYDGDWETGVGGAFFGYGPWANEPTCNYGLAVHGGVVVAVNDVVFGADVWFTIGADATRGPVVSVDPGTGETTCETSGSITPGDPATDPTADADDCLTAPQNLAQGSSGATCGAGGDGGYWVFLSGLLVSEGAGGVGANNAPTAGTITA